MSLRLPNHPMVPAVRASNGPVCIHPADRKYGVLAAGGQGSGKTSILHRLYRSDIHDPNAAPIVMDPKSELARLCLETTPPDCGKRVWYLDLGQPMFGMSPLRTEPDRPLSSQASAIADNIVQAISDTAEGQVFQSSRRYLYHAVIGALALAHKHGGLAMFDDIFGLLLPTCEELREQAANACNEHPDLGHTAEFFRTVLPAELAHNRANTYQKLDPPRNKIETILASPALGRFFSHPVDIRLSEIVQARDILLVDANMGGVGEENARVVMHFIFQQIHSLMQRQIHLEPQERARVALICDEGSYIATRNVIKQIATHREANLDVAMGLQYLSQLGAGAESASITEEIRHGVSNLLQSQFMFRFGDPADAEATARIAMPVYQTMIRADLESRELMGITPESLLYMPVWHCIASIIATGRRAKGFIGQTYAFPKLRNGPWARHHLAALEETVGPYPDELPRTYKPAENPHQDKLEHSHPEQQEDPAAKPARHQPTRPDITAAADPVDAEQTSGDSGQQQPPGQPDAAPEAEQPDTETALPQPELPFPDNTPEQHRPVAPLIRQAGEVPEIERSRVRAIFAATKAPYTQEALFEGQRRPQPESIRELAAYVDPLLGVQDAPAERNEPPARLPRLYDDDYRILVLLDRAGVALPGMIRRAVNPTAADRTWRDRIRKLYNNGLIARRSMRLAHPVQGSLPRLYSLTKYGLQVAQERKPAAIAPDREYREAEIRRGAHVPHDLHTLSWLIELHEQLGRLATDKWRTPRWPGGTLPRPHTGNGRHRRRVTLADIEHPKHVALYDIQSSDFAEIRPDAIVEIQTPDPRITFDILIEVDLTGKNHYQEEKFVKYDAMLTGWWSCLRRYQQLGTRPIVIFVCQTQEHLDSYATTADRLLKASTGLTGSAPADRYYPGRDHIFFALEEDLHHDNHTLMALPALPPNVRDALDSTSALTLTPRLMLPEQMTRAAKARNTSRE
jgi:hypothetical protein